MPRVKITPAIRDQLNTLRETTGVGPQRLLRGRRDKPRGISSATIYSWLHGRSETAIEEHLSYVLDAWQSVDPIIEVTDAMVAELKAQFDQAGMTQLGFLKISANVNSVVSRNFLSRLINGTRKTVPKSVWEALISSLVDINAQIQKNADTPELPASHKSTSIRETPKRPYIGRASNASDKKKKTVRPYISHISDDLRAITEEELTILRTLIAETGVKPKEMLQRNSGNKPDKLSAGTVSQWLNGYIKRSSSNRIAWVIKQYRDLLEFN